MKLHVDVGGDILSAIDVPYRVLPIVRCHHENRDGSGYPRGVRALAPAQHHEALAQSSRVAAPPAGTSAPPASPPDLRPEASDDLLALVRLARVVTAQLPFADVLSLAVAQIRRVPPFGTCAIHFARMFAECRPFPVVATPPVRPRLVVAATGREAHLAAS